MEETDPSQVVRGRKHIVETGAPGAVPMVPPMGMPMSPHMPGQPAQPVEREAGHLVADPQYLPDQGFGGTPGLPQAFSGVEWSAMTPAVPAAFTPASPAIPATPGTPAMQGVPAAPLQEALVQQGEPRILPAGVEPDHQAITSTRLADHDGSCCCCGDFHDGQENRQFRRGDEAGQGTPEAQHAGEPRHLTHDTQNTPAGQADTPRGEVTKPVPTDDDPPASDACCACCGEEHPGLGDSENDSLTNDPGAVVEPGEEDEDEPGADDEAAAEDDDCPHDDDKPGDNDDDTDNAGNGTATDDDEDDDDEDHEHGNGADDETDDDTGHDEDHDDLGNGNADDDENQDDEDHGNAADDDCPRDDDKPADDDEQHGNGNAADDEDHKPDDKNHHDDHKPGDDGKTHHGDGTDDSTHDPGSPDGPGGLPATQPATSVDVPQSPRTLPAPTDGGSAIPPGSAGHAVPPGPVGNAVPPGSTSQGVPSVEGTPQSPLLPRTPATQPESAYRLEPMQPGQPGQAGQLQPKLASRLAPVQPNQTSPLQPTTALSRVEAPKATPNNQPATGGGQPAYTSVKPTTTTPPTQAGMLTPAMPAVVSTPPTQSTPGQNTPGQNTPGQNTPGQNTPATAEALPRQALMSTKPAVTTNGGSPYTGTGTFPGVGPQGPGVPQDGNVGPDPNVKFDEASYNQLTSVIAGMRDTLDDAYMIDVVYLDAELLLQPNGQKWDPAVKLVARGGKFGGSVETESEALRKTLTTFATALEQAKAVFKDTNDLAAYDATKFTTEYPGFSSGPGVV